MGLYKIYICDHQVSLGFVRERAVFHSMEKLFVSQRAQLNILMEGIGELGKGESAFTDREQLQLFNSVGFLCLVVIVTFFNKLFCQL